MSALTSFVVGFLVGGLLMSIALLAVRRGHPWGRRRGDPPQNE